MGIIVYITYLSYVYIGTNAVMNDTSVHYITIMIGMNVVDNLNSV